MFANSGMRLTSHGSIRPASRYFDTICEQGCATSALKPGRHFLERLVIVAEEGIGRHLAVLGDIVADQGLVLEAGPVEHDQVGIGGMGRQGQRDGG